MSRAWEIEQPNPIMSRGNAKKPPSAVAVVNADFLRGEIWRWPVIVFVIGLLITASVAWFASWGSGMRDTARFENVVQRTGTSIEAKLEAYIALLRAGAGVFAGSQHVERDEFRAVTDRVQLDKFYPGVQGIGFAKWVTAAERADFVASQRRDGWADFEISPSGGRDEYVPIVFLEPQDRRNLRAIGYDMLSESTRREAMERARDQGSGAASRRVVLVQEIDARKQPGFLIYVPVYRGGRVPETVAERRAALEGFVYSPFRADDLLAGLLGGERMPRVNFEVYDGLEVAPEQLLHRSANAPSRRPAFDRTAQLHVADRIWTVRYRTTDAFDADSTRAWVTGVAVAGVFISAALGWITLALTRAEARARARGREIAESREQLRVTLSSIGDAVISTDAHGCVTFMNPVAEHLTGWTVAEVRGRLLADVFHLLNEETRTRVPNPVEAVLRDGVLVALANHTVLISKGGARIPIDDSAAPIRSATGEMLGVVLVFHDVTEQRRAGKALRERERLLQAVADGARVGLVIINHRYEYLFANQAYGNVVGLEKETIVGQKVPDVMAAGWSQIQPRLDRALAGERISYELKLSPVAGSSEAERLFTIIYEPQNDEGEATVVVVMVDISERKRGEDALRLSEARKDAILRSALDAIVTINHESVLVEFNPAAERIFGYTRDEVIGRQLSTLIIPARFRERHHRGIAHYLATGEGPVLRRQVEMPAMRADGTEFPAELAILPIPGAEPPMFTAFLRDITERKQNEQQLREAAERIRFMAESMPQKIFTARADGEFEYFNQQWMQFTGLTLDELQRGGWAGFVHADEVPENIRHWDASIAKAEPFQFEHRIRRHDGAYRWHLTRALAFRDTEGRVQIWIGSNTDIDDQKREEERLEKTVAERTTALSETNEQLEAFVYTIAHDLRGPLRSIAGYSQLLADDYAAALDEPARHLLERIQGSAEFMDRLILDLLAFGRTARAEIELSRVDVRKAWSIALAQTADQREQAQAEIETIGALPSVLAHEATLGQVFANLLSNAMKFVAPGVRPHIRLRSEDRGDLVRLWVEDNGIGIPPELKERVFRVFERLNGSRYAGTGIGLSIVRKGVERMGGKVDVESTPGEGSRFWIELKKADEGRS